MASVRDATLELFRAHGMTTIFGNPGSTELPMLRELPEDFTYVLGLQEQAVVGMADGYAQATGRPTHVNLHTAPGVGNAVGAIGVFGDTNRMIPRTPAKAVTTAVTDAARGISRELGAHQWPPAGATR